MAAPQIVIVLIILHAKQENVSILVLNLEYVLQMLIVKSLDMKAFVPAQMVTLAHQKYLVYCVSYQS